MVTEKGGGMISCLLFALFCPRVRSIVKHKSLEGDSHREHISHPDTPCHQLDDKKREGEPPLRVGGGGWVADFQGSKAQQIGNCCSMGN